jgi:hypothetical protein
MIEKSAGRWAVRAFTDGWPIAVRIIDIQSDINPCERIELRGTLEEMRDLAFALERAITLADPSPPR